MNNKKKIMYIGILLIITVIVSITYFSYAFLTQTDVHNGKINIVAGTLTYRLKIDNQETNTVIVPAGDTKEVEVKVKSLNSIDSKFELYYLNIEGIDVNYSVSTDDIPSGAITSNEEKIITVILTNNTNTNKEITLGVSGSLMSNNIELASNMNSITEMDECNIPIGTVYNFDYTGSAQTFTPACKGKYKVELWGAQGGNINSIQTGGKGAYTEGIIQLKTTDNLYVYVGNQPALTENAYNGGGNTNNSFYPTSDGGGSTDIRYFDSTPTSQDLAWDSILGLKSRIMVAGAGAGGYNASVPGGAAGGLTGYGGAINWSGYDASNIGYPVAAPTGGTQISGGNRDVYGNGSNGAFGIGGNGELNYGGGAGGGGYYGGGGGGNSRHLSSGAGGSSFISGYSGCDAISASSTQGNIIHTNQPNHYSGKVFSDSVMIDGTGCNWSTGSAVNCGANQPQPNGTNATGHSGNGYARITYLGNGEIVSGTSWTFDYTGNEQVFTAPKNGAYKLEVWGAQGGTIGAANGYGGYSTGIIGLNTTTPIYVVVGGKGQNQPSYSSTAYGGYNGGGNGGPGYHYSTNSVLSGGGGGGATHIAKVSGTLASIGYNSFVTQGNGYIVAGGAGGSTGTNGGSGGGYIGVAGEGVASFPAYHSTGGTQSVGGIDQSGENNCVAGTFGQGSNFGGAYGGAGGGGGLFGGGGSNRNHGGAGGGSGYIGNSLLTDKKMVCYNCTTSTAVNTYTESNTCVNATPTSDCSKMGNGYAKITYMGTRKVTFNANGGEVDEKTRKISYGDLIGTLPTPTKTGRVFLGWYTDNTYTTKVNNNYIVTEDITLYALYGDEINLNLTSRTQGYPSNTEFAYTSKRILPMNTYIVGLAFDNSYSPSTVSNYQLGEDSYYVLQSSGYGIGLPMQLSNGNYVISGNGITTGNTLIFSIIKYTSDGSSTYTRLIDQGGTYTFNVTSDSSFEALVITSNGINAEVTVTNLHLYKID